MSECVMNWRRWKNSFGVEIPRTSPVRVIVRNGKIVDLKRFLKLLESAHPGAGRTRAVAPVETAATVAKQPLNPKAPQEQAGGKRRASGSAYPVA